MAESPTTAELDDHYFTWLYSHIGLVSDRNPSHSHWMLAEQLYRKNFVWFVPNDDNRATDGLFLRDEFCDRVGSWHNPRRDDRMPFEPCTMLEMLIGVAKRASFEGDDVFPDNSVGGWFWRILNNVGLKRYSDDVFMLERPHREIEIILDNIVERRYAADGTGGLFPLQYPVEDQRKTEIWYQMSAYILENSDIGH